MNVADYLDRLLARYARTFTISQPYDIHGKEYPAYGYFFSQIEKYVLVREANLWRQNSYEHVLFLTCEELTGAQIDEAVRLVREYMEPELVLHGRDVPEPEHLSSYMTVAFLCQKPITGALRRRIRHYAYDRGYKMNLRGFCQARFVAASMDDRKVCANFAARKLKSLYRSVYQEVDQNRPGLSEVLQKRKEQESRESASDG